MDWLKKHDVLTKAFAILVSLVLWLYVINVTDLSKDYKVRKVSPIFVGEEEIMAAKNLMIVGEYTVDVEVTASRQDILSLDKADIKVEVDVSNITEAGTYDFFYTVELPSSEYTLKKKNPQKLTVKIDEEAAKNVPIRFNTDTLPANGYVVDMTNISVVPSELRVSGLRDEIEKISYAELIISRTDSKTTISEKVPYNFYDNDGNLIKNTSVAVNYSEIDIHVPILKKKKLPLSIDLQGNEFVKKYVFYTFDPIEIEVAGEEWMINQMTSLPVGTVEVSEIASGITKEFTLTMPDKVLNLSGETEATANIEIDGLNKKKVTTTLFEVKNIGSLPSGSKVRPVTTKMEVTILGTDDVLRKVNSSNVRVVADLNSTVLSSGVHPVNATVVVDGIEGAVSDLESYTIYIEVD